MSEQRTPNFDESDPCWARLDGVAALLGIKHARLRQIRKQLGNAFEHDPGKPGQPKYIYAPLWVRAWCRLTEPAGSAGGGQSLDDDQLFKRARREKMELELAEARRELVRLHEVVEIFDVASIAIHQVVDDLADPQLAKHVADRLGRIEKEFQAKLQPPLNGPSATSNRPAS